MDNWKSKPVIVIDLFPEILQRLIKLLGSLTQEEWGLTTACAGWSVKDIAGHLLGDEIGMLSRKRDGFRGPLVHFANWDELVAGINQMNQDWVDATRRLSPNLLVDLLQVTGTQVCEFFNTLDLYALGSPVSWAGPDPAPVWLDLAREYTERWHHQQHIRDALNKPGLKEARYLKPVLATFVHALPHTYRDVWAPEGAMVALSISGEAGGEWSLVKGGEGWLLYQDIEGEPQARLVIQQEDAWRLFTKGLDKRAAHRRVQIEGDRRLGEVLLEAVAIIA